MENSQDVIKEPVIYSGGKIPQNTFGDSEWRKIDPQQ